MRRRSGSPRAVGYVGAGTCEFLLDERGEPVFLEMNTRLQVEHPVTELVTGRDLVADQLRIAAGERLGLTESAGIATGHAVEVRLYAEDAEAGFLPATGRVEALAWPAGDGIRVDAGIELGSEIGGRFDPMLAKIIAWGPDRADGARAARGRPRPDRRPRRRDQPAVPALAGPPAGGPPGRGPDRRPDPDLAAGRLGGAHGHPRCGLDRRGGPPAGRRRSRPTRGPAAGGSTPGDRSGWRPKGSAGSSRRTGAPAPSTAADGDAGSRPSATGDTVHLDLAGRSVAFRAGAAARRRRRGAGGRRAWRGRGDRAGRARGADARRHPDGPRHGRPGRRRRRPGRDPRGDEDGARRGGLDRRTRRRTSLVRPADQVTRGQRLATIEP